MARRSENAVTGDELKRMLGGGLGGSVRDGDTRHPRHSAMVTAVGNWLNDPRRHGVLVWATYTGRPTDKATYGTPGVPDLIGWRTLVDITLLERVVGPGGGETGSMETTKRAQFLAVECKVGKDTLRPAQAAFRKECEDAGGLYFLAHWSGDPNDSPTADLERQWKETTQ